MADISTILVYCFLNVAVNLVPSRGVRLNGIPTVNYRTRQRLTCYDGGWRGISGISDASFYLDGTKFAVVGRGSWFRCKLKWLKTNLNENDFGISCDWNRRSLIIKKVDGGYNNTVWHCKSRGETSKKYIVKVEDLSTCSVNASISGTISNVVEGSNLHLTCDTTNTTENGFTYSWIIYYNNGSVTNFPLKTIDKTASRNETGTYNCQIKKKENCMSEAQIDINVQYHPTAFIHSESNSTINLTCIGYGYPDIFTFYGWHHFINDQLVRILKGNETRSSSILILDKVTALDNGNYVCILSNGISDKSGNLNSSANYSIKLPATPFAMENEIQDIDIKTGDNVSMTAVFVTEDVKSVTLMSPDDTQKKLNVTDVIREEYRDIGWYESTVNVSVIVVQYFIQNVMNEGHYYFNVCNVYELCDESVGLKVKFSTTEEPHSRINVSDKQEQEQNLPVILGTSAAVIIVIVIIVICVVVVRRRASSPKIINANDHSKVMYSQSNPVYGDRNVEIIPNDLYHASERQNNTMEIIPNELYVPSEPKPDTHENMEIIPNELYVSSDADNQNGNPNASGFRDATPDELYVGEETIKKNKEIQKQMKSRYPDQEQVYVNDPMSQ